MIDRRQALKAAAALAGLAGSGRAAFAQAPSVISLSEQGGWFLAEVAVNGSGGYRFVLDTGSTAYFISRRLVGELGLRAVEQRMVGTYAGRRREPVVAISRLKVGDVEVGGARAIAWTPGRLEDHDGLLGYPLLYPRATIALGVRQVTLGDPPRGLALTPVNAQVTRAQTVLMGGVDGAPGKFVFDTGSQVCTVSAGYLKRIEAGAAYAASTKLTYRTQSGASGVRAFRPPKIAFGGFEIPEPVIRIDQQDGREGVFQGGMDGLFGVNLMRPYTWVLDQAAGTLLVAPGEARRAGYVGSGFNLERRDGVLRVAAVADDSPASEAGVLPGQRVLNFAQDDGLHILELAGRRSVSLRPRALL